MLKSAFRMIPPSLHTILLLLLTVGWAACLGEAEHSNPLDPNSDRFEQVGTLVGTTTRFYPPFAIIGQAEVRLSPGPFVTMTDAEGRFVFDGIPVGDYRLDAVKEGFASGEQVVQVELGTPTEEVQVRMDGLPLLRELSVRSAHISRWFPPDDLYLLEIVALVEDPDGLSDVDRVAFAIPTRGFERDLAQTNVTGRYEVALPADSLPGGNLFALQGEEIRAMAQDAAGFETASGPHVLVRVIDYTPVALEPQGQENVRTATPEFSWEDAALPYHYSYRVDIVHDQANVRTVVRTIEDIPQDNLSHTLETPLPPGTYFWTISVVDARGNRSQSKEAGFIVPQ